MHRLRTLPALLVLGSALTSQAQEKVPPPQSPPGAPKSATTQVLETGSRLLQNKAPVNAFDIYLVGFHPMKEQPEMQLEAHHYCHQMNEDFAQCVLFDGNTKTANLHGVEYIISEKLFATLPASEQPYWHPHNGEILSGQLIAPGIPKAAEKALMKSKLNSYGKTWHLWNTGHAGHPNDPLPLGMPMLAWSFSRDGEILPGLTAQRDKKLDVDTEQTRKERGDLTPHAHPQSGVDDLKGKFQRPTRDIPGARSR